MKRVAVNSSSLRALGYDLDEQALEVEFHNGSLYRYEQVPADVVQALNAGLRKALADENVKRRLISVGSPGQASSPEEWLATLKKEDAGARLLAKSGKLKVD